MTLLPQGIMITCVYVVQMRVHSAIKIHFDEVPLCSVCESLSLSKTMVTGKVVLCFTSRGRRLAVTTASAAVKRAGGVGLIVAKNPSDGLYPCDDDFPCIEVDYEIGTRIVFYIRSTR